MLDWDPVHPLVQPFHRVNSNDYVDSFCQVWPSHMCNCLFFEVSADEVILNTSSTSSTSSNSSSRSRSRSGSRSGSGSGSGSGGGSGKW